MDLSRLRSGNDRYSRLSREELSERFDCDTARTPATAMRWALRLQDQIPRITTEESLEWGRAIVSAREADARQAKDRFRHQTLKDSLEYYTIPQAAMPLVHRVFHEKVYAFTIGVDPCTLRFCAGSTPLEVKRIAAGSKQALFDLCESALNECPSYAMLQDMSRMCVEVAEQMGLNVMAIKEIASERYRAIEREEI